MSKSEHLDFADSYLWAKIAPDEEYYQELEQYSPWSVVPPVL